MKKTIGIVAVVLFFLVLLALVVVKLLPSQSSNSSADKASDPFVNAIAQPNQIQTDSPIDTVRTCYAWYVQASGYGGNVFSAQEQKETSACFTSNFISFWNTDESGGDPILLAQYVGKTWNNISVRPISQSINSSDILVTMGTGAEQNQVVAHVVKNNGTWKIDSVSEPQGL